MSKKLNYFQGKSWLMHSVLPKNHILITTHLIVLKLPLPMGHN